MIIYDWINFLNFALIYIENMNFMFRGWLNIKFNINVDIGEIFCIIELLLKIEDIFLREVLS